jgi:hypothetical protein
LRQYLRCGRKGHCGDRGGEIDHLGDAARQDGATEHTSTRPVLVKVDALVEDVENSMYDQADFTTTVAVYDDVHPALGRPVGIRSPLGARDCSRLLVEQVVEVQQAQNPTAVLHHFTPPDHFDGILRNLLKALNFVEREG